MTSGRRNFLKLSLAATLAVGAKGLTGVELSAAEKDKYALGTETLEKITGTSGAQVVESLKDIAPDLSRWIIEFSYADVLSRPALDLRSREIATVAALTAMGTAAPQLKVHINGALNVGVKPEEVIEVILQMAVYAGFPACINGINIAREVFEERGLLPKKKKSN